MYFTLKKYEDNGGECYKSPDIFITIPLFKLFIKSFTYFVIYW